jgi:hypothetical protein
MDVISVYVWVNKTLCRLKITGYISGIERGIASSIPPGIEHDKD